MRGSEFIIEADTVVPASGEIPDRSFLDAEKFDWTENKTIRIDPRTMMTDIGGIFAGGDVVSGPATVIEAMAAGRKAALSIDKYLRGERLEDEKPLPYNIGVEGGDFNGVNS